MTEERWVYRFGDVEVEPAAHRVARDGNDVAVEPKAFAVLVALLEQAGRALERDELLDRVWGHRHVTPGVLNRVVAQLRKALGDDAEHPRYIQTLHSLGYRFIGEVERVATVADARATAETAAMESTDAVTANALPVLARPAGRMRVFVLASVLAMVAIAFGWMQRASPVRPEASVAVLPFTSLSSRAEDSYFAEGLAVEMHDALAGVQGLTVAARMTPTGADDHDADVKAIGRQLGVATVLDASVRREGERLRINARLSDCTTGYTLWSRSYDRELSDVFATQSEIANDVVASLVGVIPDADSLRKRLTPTTNVAAFDAYLRGMDWLRRSKQSGDAEQAIGFFRNALAADDKFARAQAGICRSEVSMFETRRDAGAFERARAACERAGKMDPGLSEVNLAQAELHYVRGDFGKAIEYYTKAEIDPARRPSVYVGMAMIHGDHGRHEQALEYFKRAQALRPGDASIHSLTGYYRYLAGDMTGAIASYREAIELQPGNSELWNMLGMMYLNAGDNASGARALHESVAIEPNYAALSNLGELEYQAGNYAEAAELHRRATLLEPDDFLPWGNLGDALLADPATAAQARPVYSEAAVRAQRYVDIKSNDAKGLAALGWYRANLGQADLALELVKRSEALGEEPAEVALLNAQTLTTLGDLDQARRRIADARAAGLPENRITTNAVLRHISGSSFTARSTRADLLAPSDSEGRPPGE